MSNKRIKQTLAELHRDLERAGDVDPDLRRLLGEVDRDIHTLLERDSAGDGEASDLADRAEEMAADFAAQYPKVEKYLREVAEMLSKLGI
jgi:hypothetical protein